MMCAMVGRATGSARHSFRFQITGCTGVSYTVFRIGAGFADFVFIFSGRQHGEIVSSLRGDPP
jgi:hypothetical protein